MPPLPESMHYPHSGWWWIHAFGTMAVFCWGWFVGQNRAERRFLAMLQQREKEK